MAVKAASPRSKGKTRKTAEDSVNLQEVAEVAYALYIERGMADGYDKQDWFEAQRIIRQRRSKKR